MKGHYIFSALLGIGLLLQGCETLDYTPADQLNDKTFWRTEQPRQSSGTNCRRQHSGSTHPL